MAGGEQAAGDPAAHRPQADESDRTHRSASFDLLDVLGAELEARRAEDRVDLVGPAEADDRAIDGRVAQRPRDRDRPRRRVVALRDGRQALAPAPGAVRARAPESARRACASRRRAGSRSARGSCPPSADPSPSASRRSRRSPRARRTAGSRPRPRARSASTAAAASRPARSAGSGAAARRRSSTRRCGAPAPAPSARPAPTSPPRCPPRGRASGSGRGRSRRPPAAPGWPRPHAISESRLRLCTIRRPGPSSSDPFVNTYGRSATPSSARPTMRSECPNP